MATADAVPVWDHSLDYRGNRVVSVGAAMLTISGLVVIGRLYTRLAIVRNVGIEEAWIVGSWLAAMMFLITLAMMTKYGLGHHIWTLTPATIGNHFKWFWVLIWVYNISLTCTKFSIIFQYKRIFVTPRFQIAVNVMLGIMTIYGLWTLFGCIFICWPIQKFWNPTVEGHCMPQWPIFFGNTYMNIITDLMIILSPMPVLSNLHMPVRQKIALGGIFAGGTLICVFSIVRLKLLYDANESKDFTYDNYEPAMWSIMEANIAIMTASAPSLKALVVRIFPRFGSTLSGTNSKPGYGKSTNQEKSRVGITSKIAAEDRDMASMNGRLMGRSDEESQTIDGKINVMTTITAEVNAADENSPTGSSHGRVETDARH